MKKSILITLILVIASVTANAQNKTETSKVVHLTYSEFIKNVWDFEKDPSTFKYKGKLPAIIDFYADWCRPCRMTAPILEKIANEYDGKLLVYKINVDEERELASVFDVQAIPTLLFIPLEGKPIPQVGALDEEGFKERINTYLLK